MNKISNEGITDGSVNYYTPSRMQLKICIKVCKNVHMLCLKIPCLVNWPKEIMEKTEQVLWKSLQPLLPTPNLQKWKKSCFKNYA